MPIERRTKANFNEFQEAAAKDVGFAKRALTRYLFPKNINRSISRHERLGTPIVKKVVMGTLGRIVPAYKLRSSGSLEAALDFGVSGSVAAEAIHTGFAANLAIQHPNISSFANPLVDLATDPSWHHLNEFQARPALLAFNLSLVALQRYNRARVAHVVDRGLQHGRYPDTSYRNWLHLDGRTTEHFEIDEVNPQRRPFDWEVDALEIDTPATPLEHEVHSTLCVPDKN